MKRALIVAVLLLMIMTSFSAGTLAVYTSTIDLVTAPISAKQFALAVNQGSTSEFDLQIAPGDTVSYHFEVSNRDSEGRVSQVDMDLRVEADFSSVYQALPGIAIRLYMEAGGGYQPVAECDSAGRLSFTRSVFFSASTAAEERFSLTFSWADSEAARAVIMAGRVILPLALYVRGEQHV